MTTLVNSLSSDQQLELVYVGYFNRAAEGAGFVFWEQQYSSAIANGQSPTDAINNIANSFGSPTQNETTQLYPFLAQTNPDYKNSIVQSEVNSLINSIYTNLFNRSADSPGQAYWAGQLESGNVGLGQIILDIANGAQAGSTDYNLVTNKVTTALSFTQETAAAGYGTTEPMSPGYSNEAHYILTLDTATDTSAASAEITAFDNGSGHNSPAPATTFTLTTAIDNLTASSGNNIFIGTLDGNTAANNTLNAGDSITGGGTNNTLKVVVVNDPTINLGAESITGIQHLVIQDGDNSQYNDILVGNSNTFADIKLVNVYNANVYQVNEGTAVTVQALGGGSSAQSDYSEAYVYFNNTTASSVTMNDTVSGAANEYNYSYGDFYHGDNSGSENGLTNAKTINAALTVENQAIANNDGYAEGYQYIYAEAAGNAGATINTTLNVTNNNASDGSSSGNAEQFVYQTGDAHVNATVNISNTKDMFVEIDANDNSSVVAAAANNSVTVNVSNFSGISNAGIGAYGFNTAHVNVTGATTLNDGFDFSEYDSTKTDANSQTVTVNASANFKTNHTYLDYHGSTSAVVTGSGNVDLGNYDASGSSTLSSTPGAVVSATIDASGLSGNFSVNVLDAVNLVKGGAGNDVILLENVSTFSSAALGGLMIDGGAGSNTIGFTSTEWTGTISVGSSTALAGITNFQTLEITDQLVTASTYDVSALSGSSIKNFIANDGVVSGGTASVTHLADGSTVTLNGTLTIGTGDGTLNISLTTANLTPTVNLVLDGNFMDNNDSTSDVTVNLEHIVATTNIATLNVDSTGTDTSLPFNLNVGYKADTATNDLTLSDTALVTLKVTGDQALQTTLDSTFTKLATVDASTNTGGLTLDVHGVASTQALTIMGTSATDHITVGGGADTITLHGGVDTVAFYSPSASSAIFTTINDIVVKDVLAFTNTTIANASGLLGAALTSGVNDYQTFLNAGASKAAGTLSWFEFSGNTFIETSSGNSSYTAGSDSVIKLAGLHDLSHSVISTGLGGTLTIA
jgi:hypothetical protein